MSDTPGLEARTTLLGRIFCGRYDSIQATDKALVVRRKGSIVFEIPYADIISFPDHTEAFFSAKIGIPTNNGSGHAFGWLKKKQALRLRDFLNSRLKSLVNAKIRVCAGDFDDLTLNHYPRDSWEENLIHLGGRLSLYKPHIDHDLIDEDNRSDLKRIYEFLPVNLGKLREVHEKAKLLERKEFFDSIEAYPLTPEQRLGVIRSNDSNMVLAAAKRRRHPPICAWSGAGS